MYSGLKLEGGGLTDYSHQCYALTEPERLKYIFCGLIKHCMCSSNLHLKAVFPDPSLSKVRWALFLISLGTKLGNQQADDL